MTSDKQPPSSKHIGKDDHYREVWELSRTPKGETSGLQHPNPIHYGMHPQVMGRNYSQHQKDVPIKTATSHIKQHELEVLKWHGWLMFFCLSFALSDNFPKFAAVKKLKAVIICIVSTAVKR